MVETTTTANIIRQAPFLEAFQRRLLDQAFLRGETSVDIPDIQAASLDPLTEQAIAKGQGIGQFQDYLTQGAETIGEGLGTLQERTAGVPDLFGGAERAAHGSGQRFTPTEKPPQPRWPFSPPPWPWPRPPQATSPLTIETDYKRPVSQPGHHAAYASGDQTSLQPYLDPYQKLVTQEALGEYQRQADIQQNQLAQQAIGAGAFGGSRFGVQGAELGRNLADIKSRRIFEDLSRNFSQAQNAASTAFENQQRRQQGISQLLTGIGQAQSQEASRLGEGIGQFGTLQANLAGIGQGLVGQEVQTLSGLGALKQTQAQRELDAARQSQLQRAYEPFQRIGFTSDIFKPAISSGQSTIGVTTAPSPSPLSQAIGVGVGALGLNKALGNPFGNIIQGIG